jgi:hypothetical protein
MITITNCRFCGKDHGARCPDVKAIEYAEDGVTVRRVEFVTAADFLAPLTAVPLSAGPATFGQFATIPSGPCNTWGQAPSGRTFQGN